jgi:phage-related minor tail protein
MDELGDVADLRSAKRTSEDVTTEVIDIGVRVRAQEKSLERVELLLARAQDLRAIIAIESQLTRRQAELDSLKAQQAYLADQTTLSTITVFLEQTEQPQREERDEAGFLSGLEGGWDALARSATVLATVIGAVLPFAVVLLLLGVPLWLLVRSLVRRRQPEPVPAD